MIQVGNTSILIDAGKSARTLCNALREVGSDVSKIQAIFVTHDHHDHTSALEMVAKKYSIPIHMTAASATCFDRYEQSPIHSCLLRHDTLYSQAVGELTVTSFRTPHDSRMSVGYRIEFEDEGRVRALGFATDVGYVSDAVRQGLLGCEAVVLESNHDIDMLTNGPYPYYLKQRIRSSRGHLSNADSAAFAAYLAQHGTRGFLLAHLSEENNEPMLALNEALGAICDDCACVCVAAADVPTELLWQTTQAREVGV